MCLRLLQQVMVSSNWVWKWWCFEHVYLQGCKYFGNCFSKARGRTIFHFMHSKILHFLVTGNFSSWSDGKVRQLFEREMEEWSNCNDMYGMGKGTIVDIGMIFYLLFLSPVQFQCLSQIFWLILHWFITFLGNVIHRCCSLILCKELLVLETSWNEAYPGWGRMLL